MADDFLTKEQKKPLLDAEVASVDNDITRGYLLPLLDKQDPVLDQHGGNGVEYLDIYTKVRKDPKVSACYFQRFSRLIRFPIEVIAASDSAIDQAAADWWRIQMPKPSIDKEAAQFNINKIPMDDITTKMMFCRHYGFSLGEKMLTKKADGLIYLDISKGAIKVRRRDRIKFDKEGKPRLITLGNMYEGEPIHESRAWVMRCGGDNSDNPYGEGLDQILYWLTLFKRGATRHELNFLDNFSRPSAKVEYPAGSQPEEKKKAQELAQALGEGRSISLAQGFVAELLQSTGKGTADFASLQERCDHAITLLILGQSGTTENGAWAGTAETHENVANDIVVGDGDFFSESFYQNVSVPITFYNFPNANAPYIRYRTEPEKDIDTRVKRDKEIVDLGGRLTPEKFTEVYGDGYEYNASQSILNGPQLQALTQMTIAASAGQMSADTLEEIIISTMGVTVEAAAKIVAPIRNQPPQPQILAPQDTTPPPQVSTQPQPQNNATNPQFSELLSGEIYDFADTKPTSIEDIAANTELVKVFADHAAKWQERIDLAYKESADYYEFTERFAGLYEGMERSRQELAAKYAQADRASYLAGIAEAEGDAN
jgi:hypothetical protein